MTIRQAVAGDLGPIMAIVREVVSDMRAVGNSQWDDAYPDEARFMRDIENGALYVAVESDDVAIESGVIGFVAVDQDEPEGYRGLPWSSGREAFVIHRFAVARRSRGLGTASLLETFVCRHAQERGIDHVKVDTYSANAGMQEFLTKKGYRKVGEMTFRGKELLFFCYEKRV